MPLSEKARVEVYLPDLPKPAYQDLLAALDREFTYTFGGCTIIRGLDGSYLSQAGQMLQDRIALWCFRYIIQFEAATLAHNNSLIHGNDLPYQGAASKA